MKSNQKPSFLLNTMILTLAGGFARVLGAVYRIFLTRIIGDVGIGLYQMAYNLALVFMTVGMTGLPLAISKIVAEKTVEQDEKGTRKVLWLSMLVSGALGLLIAALLGLGAPYWIEFNLKEPRALLPLQCIAPAVFFVFLMAPFRGYFQGKQNMIPRAMSDTVEQLVRVVMILVLALLLIGRGLETAAAGAAMGVSLGAAAGFLYLLLMYLRTNRQKDRSGSVSAAALPEEKAVTVLQRLLKLAIPVTLGSLIWPLMQFMDTLLITGRLQSSGFSVEEATTLFGRYSGQAGPLINMPSILTVAVAASLIPSITEAMVRKDGVTMRSRANLALKMSVLIALPAALGLNLLSGPVAQLLYGSANAGNIIAVYSWVILFLLLYQTSASILQGIDRISLPVYSMLVGVAVKSVLTFLLCGIPSINIYGAAIATGVGFAIAVVMNLLAVYRYTEMRPDWRGLVIAPVISSALMGLTVYFGYPLLHRLTGSILISTGCSVMLGVLFYAVVLLLSGGLNREELSSIPKLGPAVLKILNRFSKQK